MNDISTSQKRLPGDLAMWFFILAELTVFAILFIAFAVTRQIYPSQFLAGQATLHPLAGVINTLALISSSYLVALAVNACRKNRHFKGALLLYAALACASIYLVAKLWEYQQLFDAGYDISTNTFYQLYFMITFFHFMHVLLGMVILTFVAVKAQHSGYQDGNINGLVSGASYWHMVDLVWIILFPLVYIIH